MKWEENKKIIKSLGNMQIGVMVCAGIEPRDLSLDAARSLMAPTIHATFTQRKLIG